jgi:hypothetical protein
MRKAEQLSSIDEKAEPPFSLTGGGRGLGRVPRPQQPAVVPAGLLPADRNPHQERHQRQEGRPARGHPHNGAHRRRAALGICTTTVKGRSQKREFHSPLSGAWHETLCRDSPSVVVIEKNERLACGTNYSPARGEGQMGTSSKREASFLIMLNRQTPGSFFTNTE